jgi:hypothetical protein
MVFGFTLLFAAEDAEEPPTTTVAAADEELGVDVIVADVLMPAVPFVVMLFEAVAALGVECVPLA